MKYNNLLSSSELKAKNKATETNKIYFKMLYVLFYEIKCLYYSYKIKQSSKLLGKMKIDFNSKKVRFKEKYASILSNQKEKLKKYYASIYTPYIMPFAQFLDFEKLAISKIEELKPDIIHAHDLLTTYAAVKYSKKHNIPMIYDAHEYEIHRNRKYRTFKILADQWFEWKAVKQAKRVITVSDGIAEDMAKMYNIPVPTVVLNSPSIKAIDYEVSKDIRTDLGLLNDEVIIVYVGVNTIGRGLEVMVKALNHLPKNYHFAILGPRRLELDENLLNFAKFKKVDERVHLLEPIKPIEIPNYIKTADIFVNPAQNVSKSYDFALPNKLFDALYAELLICTGDLKAMRDFINENNLGRVFNEKNHKDIASVIKDVLINKDLYSVSNKSRELILNKYSWESQENKIIDLYKELNI